MKLPYFLRKSLRRRSANEFKRTKKPTCEFAIMNIATVGSFDERYAGVARVEYCSYYIYKFIGLTHVPPELLDIDLLLNYIDDDVMYDVREAIVEISNCGTQINVYDTDGTPLALALVDNEKDSIGIQLFYELIDGINITISKRISRVKLFNSQLKMFYRGRNEGQVVVSYLEEEDNSGYR